MSNGFTYLIPGLEIATSEAVSAIFPHLQVGQRRDNSGGPGGVKGSLFCIKGVKGIPTYKPKSQTWKVWKNTDGKKIHIGWDNDAKPTPKDLQRKEMIEGTPVVLGDGNEWIVPRLRFFPKMWDLNDDGERFEVIGPKYRALVDEVQEMLAEYLNSQEITYTKMLGLVSRGLSVNYHVGEGELLAIGAIGEEECYRVFCVLTCYDELLAAYKEQSKAEKKTE